jgi:hypothetical protein
MPKQNREQRYEKHHPVPQQRLYVVPLMVSPPRGKQEKQSIRTNNKVIGPPPEFLVVNKLASSIRDVDRRLSGPG